MEFDSCQFDTEWEKSTTILVFNNKKFQQRKRVTCKVTYENGESICSKTGKPHVLLSGFKGEKNKGQYKTNVACPYPPPFCEYVADLVVEPEVYPRDSDVEPVPGLPAAVKVEPPPASHYITHLPKHPGCTACMNCKVQRKHCRDLEKARRRKLKETYKTEIPKDDEEIDKLLTEKPKKFGDLVSSDSIFVIKRSSTSSARHGDTTALVVRDKATGWLAAYPAKRKAAEDIKVAVNDFKGSETIQRWYSDGAPELHAVCRELGIRHDISDPHRSETNGAIERTNRTVIEGARCLLFQS